MTTAPAVSFTRRLVAGLGLALAALGASGAAIAADYPSRPITIVLSTPPGASTDAVARMIAQHLQKTFGQPVIVDSRPGAGGVIAAQLVAKAPADGHTLFFTLTSYLTAPLLNPNAGYHPLTSFAPVSHVVTIGTVLAARSGLGVSTMDDLVKLARANPGKVSVGSTGNGSVAHIYAEMINDAAKIQLLHIPYKGGAPANTDLLAGQLDLNWVDPGTYRSFKPTGKVRGLAINGTERSALAPEVPTFGEQGIQGVATQGWFGLFAPAATPAEVVDKLSQQIGAFLRQPEVREKLLNDFGAVAVGSTADQFRQKLQSDYGVWSSAVKKYKIQMD